MPFEPFRFIHAANLALDHPLRETGPLPDEIRKIVEDSTLTAFERVVSACIEKRVDFLLLTGSSFVEQDRSLRARAALLRGFDRLAEHNIRVFAMPGRDDPPEAWQTIENLPDNVTPFFSRTGQAVAVIRDAKVIASVAGDISGEGIAGDKSRDDPSRFVGSRRTPFAIGLLTLEEGAEVKNLFGDETSHAQSGQRERSARLSDQGKLPRSLSECLVDYVALGGGDTRQAVALEAGIAHNPGGTQGLGPRETGPHGCTLVSVGPDGTLQSTFIPTAAVRWEWFEAKIDANANRDELAEMMRTALAECRPEAGEKVYLISWSIHGSGPLFESLHDEGVQGQLIDLCTQNTWCDGGLLLQHTFHLCPESKSATGDDPLSVEYLELLESEQSFSGKRLETCLEQAALPNSQWSGRVQAFTSELNHAAVVAHARQLGTMWLAANLQEESTS